MCFGCQISDGGDDKIRIAEVGRSHYSILFKFIVSVLKKCFNMYIEED